MNLAELGDALERIGVSPQVVALGGHAEYCWCVEQAEDGAWEVFWRERGNKNNLVRLPTEETACFQLLGRLTYSQLLAGAIHGP
ncbi:hypothetical protein [Actinophytocola sp.]|uniref:hypothetical protein n=1 Tax=Actinophytocola sp. TaxID=1872138 RepID=UPI002D80B657|nr:hypothetical protein [Actinophytocola sp.]HET9137788.1 hypothetical protein [Actinophytocola sp.]